MNSIWGKVVANTSHSGEEQISVKSELNNLSLNSVRCNDTAFRNVSACSLIPGILMNALNHRTDVRVLMN